MLRTTFLVMAFATLAGAQDTASEHADQQCSVVVRAPRAGDRVGDEGEVTGTATLPGNGNLWVLARRRGLAGWWPQGGGPAQPDQGEWTVLVKYGRPGELGRFDVAVVVVGDEADANLKKWVQEAPERGYPPTEFPSSIGTCPIQRFVVEKVSGSARSTP